jgi:hypothetical protein
MGTGCCGSGGGGPICAKTGKLKMHTKETRQNKNNDLFITCLKVQLSHTIDRAPDIKSASVDELKKTEVT